jgi:hypothetical protein
VAPVNPRLLVVIVALVLVLLLTAVLLVVSQPGLTHAIGSLLQGQAPTADNCIGSTSLCP